MNHTLQKYLETESPFQSYLYSYPHKTAYRQLDNKMSVKELWKNEDKSSLYLYTHIPFCRSKCSFCNLFSSTGTNSNQIDLYIDSIEREAQSVRDNLGDFSFSGYAIGGGTPSLLSVGQLQRLFSIYEKTLNLNLLETPGSFEISPDTITQEKLQFLAEKKIERISIGIQSFIESEAKVMGRVQKSEEIKSLLSTISDYKFPLFNIDLIYGIPGQTPDSWLISLRKAIEFTPQEIFLYPLYIRPQTALFSSKNETTDIRHELYRIGRDFLLSNGYIQDSMRLFRHASICIKSNEYSCQEDGMIGLGTNARSYTKSTHYSTPYATSRQKINEIIDSYTNTSRSDFDTVDFGIVLDESERKRRYLIKSLLKSQGIDIRQYESYFGASLSEDFPDLSTLIDLEMVCRIDTRLALTPRGMSLSDLIGYWFISEQIQSRMKEYQAV